MWRSPAGDADGEAIRAGATCPPDRAWVSDLDQVTAIGERYRPEARSRWRALGIVVVIQAVLLYALATIGFTVIDGPRERPMVVRTLDLAAPPPPDKAPQPPPPEVERQLSLTKADTPTIEPPPAPNLPPTAPSPLPVASDPPSPAARPPTPAPTTAPAPPSIVAANDLTTKLISAKPPSYPTESRRKREEGVVVLILVLGTDGRVESVSVGNSSGSGRLDQAALGAVRRWRWSPTIVGGQPVRVRGSVRIPFMLTN